MTDASEIWDLETKFWTGHAPFHDETVPSETVMAFGDPLGVNSGKAARQSLDQAPDWVGVEMSEQVVERPTDDVAVTGYLAEGDAGNGVKHKVYCTSTWVRREGNWIHVQHHQTPA